MNNHNHRYAVIKQSFNNSISECVLHMQPVRPVAESNDFNLIAFRFHVGLIQ